MYPFDQLGGGIAQTMYYGQQCGFDNRLMELYRQQQQYIPAPICSHPNCPICKTEYDKKVELANHQ